MVVIGVMGPFENASLAVTEDAFALGRLIAENGWVLLTGGRAGGVMDAASRGAKAAGGLTIGIIPTIEMADVSAAVDIPVFTGMGSSRNTINALSSQVLIACGLSEGTSAEISLALRYQKAVVLIQQTTLTCNYFRSLGGANVEVADTPEKAIQFVKARLIEDECRAK